MTAETPAPLAERHLREWAYFLILVGCALRFQGLDWDQGFMFNPDERNIAMAATHLSFPDHLVPQFHAYNGLALYLPRLLSELIVPLTGRPGAAPASIIFAGRLLSAMFASLTLPLLWSIARRSSGAGTAIFVVAVAAFAPSLVQSAHFATTEAALVLCVTTMLWLSQRHTAGELALWPYAILIGLTLGAGFGFKTTALIFALIPLAAVAQTTLFRRVFATIGAGALATAIVLVLAVVTTPQLVATPAAYFDTMRFEGGVVSGAEDVFWTYQFTGAPNGLFELAQLPWLIGALVAPISLAGLIAWGSGMMRRVPQAPNLAGAALFAVTYGIVIALWHAKFVRYELPLVGPLILFAGHFVSELSSARVRRSLAVLAALLTGVAGLVQASIYQIPDPRITSWDWLEPQLTSGDHVVVEPVEIGAAYWGSSKPISIDVAPLIDASGPQKIEGIAQVVANGNWMLVASRRHFLVLPRLSERFPEMCGYYDALWSGRLGYDLVERFMRRPFLNWAIAPERSAEETFTVFDSPEVMILKNNAHLPAARIAAEISAASARCETDHDIPMPPR